MKVNSIEVHGKRFQKSCGNTYFSAKIVVNGEAVHELPMQYGYGDHYLTVAADWLKANDYIRQADPYTRALRLVGEAEGFTFLTTVADVSRQKDL